MFILRVYNDNKNLYVFASSYEINNEGELIVWFEGKSYNLKNFDYQVMSEHEIGNSSTYFNAETLKILESQ